MTTVDLSPSSAQTCQHSRYRRHGWLTST